MRDPQAGSAVVIVPLPGEIDCTNQERACDQLSAASASGAAIVIADFTATTFCDCSSLRAVVAAKDLLAAHGAQLRLVIPPGGAVRSLATLMGVDQAVPVYLSPSEAAGQAGAAAERSQTTLPHCQEDSGDARHHRRDRD